MPYLALDSAAQQFTPAGIVTDMQTLGARWIGLYVFNNDVPDPASVVKSAAFVQEVEQRYGGPCVLPIITIRTGDSPNPAFLVGDLLQWFPGAMRRVAHDLENTAFPPLSEMQALFAAEKAARFSPGIYGFQSTQDTYAAAAPDWQWGVRAYAEGYGYLPPPFKVWQWTDFVLGGKYDGNTAADDFGVLSQTFQPPLVSSQEADVAKQIMVPDPLSKIQHSVYLVPFGGGGAQLYYRSYDQVKGIKGDPISLGGPMEDAAGVSAVIDTTANQLQVECRWLDITQGTVAHFWMPLPSGPWSHDTI